MEGSFAATAWELAPSPWPRERVAYLRLRWSQGASARRIAQELACGISRSAVLGKIHRLGIADLSPHGGWGRHPKIRRLPNHDVAVTKPAMPWPIPARIPAWVANAVPYQDDPRVDCDIPPSQRRAFLQLTPRTCRWPVGDPARPEFFFCGAAPHPSKPYCLAHCARAARNGRLD
jgi:GcrA cell cycle regulator